MGIPIPDSVWSDTRGYSEFGFRASYATLTLETTATSIVVTAINTSYLAASSEGIQVFVDGAHTTTYAVPNDGFDHDYTISLDGSSHVVEVCDGDLIGAGDTGTKILSITDASNHTTVVTPAAATERTVLYGDSIISGLTATDVADGCFQLLRRVPSLWSGRVSFLSAGGRRLRDDYNTDVTFATLAGWLVGLSLEVAPGGHRRVIVEMGFNDWFASAWDSASAFEAAYGAMLDAIHGADPSLVVLCQSPGITGHEGVPNSSPTPYTIGDVRSAVHAAAITRAGVVFVDGTASYASVATYSQAQLTDNIHPGTVGHAQWSKWWSAVRSGTNGDHLMSLSNAFEANVLALLFQNANIANLGDATGVRGSSAAGNLYVALHTANPGQTGNQATSEAAYTGYTRIAVARSSAGWTIVGSNPTAAENAATILFPACTGGASETETYVSVGRDSTGPGEVLWYGALSSALTVNSGDPAPEFAPTALQCNLQ